MTTSICPTPILEVKHYNPSNLQRKKALRLPQIGALASLEPCQSYHFTRTVENNRFSFSKGTIRKPVTSECTLVCFALAKRVSRDGRMNLSFGFPAQIKVQTYMFPVSVFRTCEHIAKYTTFISFNIFYQNMNYILYLHSSQVSTY